MPVRPRAPAVLAALTAAAAYGWWHWTRAQPQVDAETVDRLGTRR